MDKLISIDTGFQIRQCDCDLVSLSWTARVLSMDFASVNQLVRVRFEHALAHRVVDEQLDSIEGEGVREGSNRTGFAYTVQNGAFLANYPDVNVYRPHPAGPLSQYALISQNWCVEVLAHLPPTFHVGE